MAAVANWMGGLDEAGQPLQPASDANSSNSFGDPLESLVVTYPVWVVNWPQPKPEDNGRRHNPRIWLRKTLKVTDGVDWWEDVLRAEWRPSGDFIIRFGTKRSGERMMPKMAMIDNRGGGAKLSPRWATRYDLRGSLSNGVHEEIQASFERLKQDGLGRTAHAHLCSTTTTDYGSSSASSSTLTFTRVDSSAASSNSSAAYASMMGSLSSASRTSANGRSVRLEVWVTYGPKVEVEGGGASVPLTTKP